ncbi:MAG: acetylxylan esterase, partial [Victivallaceae bacterium]|nr:acetylxylan esterase [Victivallaceae bacterium]
RVRENKLDYAPGEPMTFVLEVKNNGQKNTRPYFICWKRTGDDGRVAEGKQDIALGPAVITTSLDRPGFVRIYATIQDEVGSPVKNGAGAIFFDGGAGVEIDKLDSLPEPDDFDLFWEKQKARLAAVPLRSEVNKVRETGDGAIYAVKIDCAGPRPVTGYLTVPANAGAQSLPASVQYFGYTTNPQNMPGIAAGKLVFYVNAHGFELGRDEAYYRQFAQSINTNGRGYAFDSEQNKNPETAYFNGMALRLMRSLEYIKTRPEWNRRDLTVSGGSQGGLQTIWAAGLDPDVTAANPDIPWCCDLGGVTRGRLTGGWRIPYVRGLDYYDPVNFAKRIKCPVTVGRAGLGDYVCPPSGVATFYNNLKCPKRINWFQGSTHGFVPPEPRQIFTRESK